MSKQPAALRRYWAAKRGTHRRRASTAMVRTRTRYVGAKRHRRRRALGAAAGIGGAILPAVLTAAAVGYAAENVTSFSDLIEKIPGTKTLGVPMMAGVAALAINRFAFRNKYLRLAGIAGVMVGAYQIGTKKFNVAWVGDDDVGDVEGDDDLGDDDDE